jgi:hypothetical protein
LLGPVHSGCPALGWVGWACVAGILGGVGWRNRACQLSVSQPHRGCIAVPSGSASSVSQSQQPHHGLHRGLYRGCPPSEFTAQGSPFRVIRSRPLLLTSPPERNERTEMAMHRKPKETQKKNSQGHWRVERRARMPMIGPALGPFLSFALLFLSSPVQS